MSQGTVKNRRCNASGRTGIKESDVENIGSLKILGKKLTRLNF